MAGNKKKKIVDRGMRGVRAAKTLVQGTQERVQRALGNINAYGVNNLIDDVMEQWNDVADAVFSPAAGAGVPSVFFISNAAVPDDQTVALAETTQGGLIDRTELAGIAMVSGTPSAIVIPNAAATPTTPATGFDVVHPDTGNALGASNEQLDEVAVRILAMPANPGTYRAVLRSGHLKVLAEVVVVRV